MTFLPYSSASGGRICSQINCKNTITASSLKIETVKHRLLVRLSPERIRLQQLGTKKVITNGLDGKVGKRYKERLEIQKHVLATDSGTENEEESVLFCV